MKLSRIVASVVSDVLCLALISVPTLVLQFEAEPYERGFFCNDETIKHPYKDSTVSSDLYVGVSTALPTLAIFLVELTHWSYLKRYIGNVYSTIIVFAMGWGINEFLTNLSKYTIGRLRPHFLDVCRPDIVFDEATCGPPINPVYITDFECLGSPAFSTEEERNSRITDARLSFMSGHSSGTTYAMVFAVIYIHSRLKTRHFPVLKTAVQMLCIAFAFFTCMSRISDYKHHPEDVIGGVLLGLAEAILLFRFVLPRSRKRFNRGSGTDQEYVDPNDPAVSKGCDINGNNSIVVY